MRAHEFITELKITDNDVRRIIKDRLAIDAETGIDAMKMAIDKMSDSPKTSYVQSQASQLMMLYKQAKMSIGSDYFRKLNKLTETFWDDDSDDDIDKIELINRLTYPEIINRISSMMRAMGWRGKRKGDDDYVFMTKGQLEDEWYTVTIGKAADGKGFTYALGTIEEGDPHIGQQEFMPNTVASVSMLADEIRDGFGMNENFADGKRKGKSRPGRVKRAGASCKGSVTDLRKRAKNSSGEKAKMYHWCANMKSGRNK